jgi:uncharacterized protein YjbJ (UPF0337 family)
MKWDHIQSNWPRFQNHFQEKWNRLTETDLLAIAGKREALLRRLQEVYGFSHARADRELKEFQAHLALKLREQVQDRVPHHLRAPKRPTQHIPLM